MKPLTWYSCEGAAFCHLGLAFPETSRGAQRGSMFPWSFVFIIVFPKRVKIFMRKTTACEIRKQRRSSALYFIMEVTPPNASAEWHPTCWAGRPQQDAQREAPSGSDIGPRRRKGVRVVLFVGRVLFCRGFRVVWAVQFHLRPRMIQRERNGKGT